MVVGNQRLNNTHPEQEERRAVAIVGLLKLLDDATFCVERPDTFQSLFMPHTCEVNALGNRTVPHNAELTCTQSWNS